MIICCKEIHNFHLTLFKNDVLQAKNISQGPLASPSSPHIKKFYSISSIYFEKSSIHHKLFFGHHLSLFCLMIGCCTT